MKRELKFLFIPIDAIGHMNANIGIAQVLIESGHKCMVAINDQWKGKLIPYGIEEVLIPREHREVGGDPALYYADLMSLAGILGSNPPLKKCINLFKNVFPNVIYEQKLVDPLIEQILADIKPDIVVLDQIVSLPAVMKSGILWVFVGSCNPLYYINDERTPPEFSSLPSNGKKNEWKEFRDSVNEVSFEIWKDWNKYVVSQGLPSLEENQFMHYSKHLNIYSYPLELDYTDLRPLPPNWYAFDNLKRSEKQINFEIPVELREKSGKLIYFSLGSMGGADVALMKRLVAILAKSKHRFIVSKGPLHTQYSLPDNMFGQQNVPQIQVLPVVDLVITHGGNNTVTETVYFGKPMIVMPMFIDQFDNAQRVHEKGFGLRLNPYNCSEEELLNGIENLLNDKELNEKLKTISKRIQSENSIAKLPKLFEEIALNSSNLLKFG